MGRVQHLVQARAHRLLERPPHDRLARLVEEEDPALVIEEDDRVLQAVDDLLEMGSLAEHLQALGLQLLPEELEAPGQVAELVARLEGGADVELALPEAAHLADEDPDRAQEHVGETDRHERCHREGEARERQASFEGGGEL